MSGQRSDCISLRQLVRTGCRKLLIVSLLFGIISQLCITLLLSIAAFERSEFAQGIRQDWVYTSDKKVWVQKNPQEELVIPLDFSGSLQLTVGSRVKGARYHPVLHEIVESTSADMDDSLLIEEYIPRDGWIVHQFIEDQIGFPFLAAHSMYLMETPAE